jgi:hypothetical protein
MSPNVLYQHFIEILRNCATTYLPLGSIQQNFTSKVDHEQTNTLLLQCNIGHLTRTPTASHIIAGKVHFHKNICFATLKIFV